MDIQQAKKILEQAEQAEKVVQDHRKKQLQNAFSKFTGFSSNAELIAALKGLGTEAKRRTRTRVSADVVAKIKSLEKSGDKGAAIARKVESSYVTVLNVLKGKYDGLLQAVAPKKSSKAKKRRKTNNIKLAELTDKERKLIENAKSHKDITVLPKGSKNAGKKVLYAVYASVHGVKLRGTKAK